MACYLYAAAGTFSGKLAQVAFASSPFRKVLSESMENAEGLRSQARASSTSWHLSRLEQQRKDVVWGQHGLLCHMVKSGLESGFGPRLVLSIIMVKSGLESGFGPRLVLSIIMVKTGLESGFGPRLVLSIMQCCIDCMHACHECVKMHGGAWRYMDAQGCRCLVLLCLG